MHVFQGHVVAPPSRILTDEAIVSRSCCYSSRRPVTPQLHVASSDLNEEEFAEGPARSVIDVHHRPRQRRSGGRQYFGRDFTAKSVVELASHRFHDESIDSVPKIATPPVTVFLIESIRARMTFRNTLRHLLGFLTCSERFRHDFA